MVRFRIFGIPFEVGPYFWILSAILGSSMAHGDRGLILLAIWVACVFVSIVIHELGHALMARRFGITPVVVLHGLGGTTYMAGSGLTRPQAILVTLAGPAAGLALWAVIQYPVVNLLRQSAGVSYITLAAVEFLLFINLVWTLFNLLPILPLDGGLILRNLLGFGRMAVARMIGVVCAVGCAVWAVSAGWIYGALFFGYLAYQNFQGVASLPGGAGR